METQTKKSVDVYNIVTDKIIEQLRMGTVPWRKPWADKGLPRNLISKRPYRGVNLMLLAFLNYEHNLFLTYKQLKAIGGSVNQDEQPHLVVYLTFDAEQKEEGVDEGGSKKRKGHLRYYKVYNVGQCNSIPEQYIHKIKDRDTTPTPGCEEIVQGMQNKPTIQHKGQSAYYNPMVDIVNMPKRESFESDASYYCTLFHELVHSTGHHSRLNRRDLVQMSEFGSPPYSHEELVAEIATCYLQSFAGITSEFEQSAAYIEGWLATLEYDKRFIYSASSHAQRATDFILNVKHEEESETGGEG